MAPEVPPDTKMGDQENIRDDSNEEVNDPKRKATHLKKT